MITYIVTETREIYEKQGGHGVKIKLEKISGQPCLVQYYADVTLDLIRRLGVQAVVFSGFGTALQQHPLPSFAGVYELVRMGDLPMIGLCGGHQLIAELWAEHNDRKLTRVRNYVIRPLRRDEPDLNPEYHPGLFKESGFFPIHIVRRDPLFRHVPRQFMARENHRHEVKTLPRDFILLASSKDVRVQAYRHRTRPIYGTQFHPEGFIDRYPAGKTILENFFRIAGIL